MFKQVLNHVLGLLGLSKLPTVEGKVTLSEDQKKLLNKFANDEKFAEMFEKRANKELQLAEEKQLTEKELKHQQELQRLIAENGIESLAEGKEIEAIERELNERREKIEKLSRQSEFDSPLEILRGSRQAGKIIHSKTHLYSSGKTYDALEGRPWNQAIIAKESGLEPVMTDWNNPVNIDKINEDLADYWRTENEDIITLLKDYRRLPANWPVINNVQDQIAYIGMTTGEITQARKPQWLAKNLNRFKAMIGKVWAVQIDMEWSGYDLQKLETSWMNRYQKEGSQAYKMSFVQMLVRAILEKAREEDQIVAIKGVFSPTPTNATKPASFLNRGNGLLKIIDEARKAFLYKTFKIGLPTAHNIINYTRQMCDMIPDEYKNAPGLVMYMEPENLRRYKDKRKALEGVMPIYDPNQMYVDNYPNIRIQPLDFIEGTNLIFITTEDNINLLQGFEKNSRILWFEMYKRVISCFADYKTGIMVNVFGMERPNEPFDYKDQIFWSNEVELLNDITVPVEANATVLTAKYHHALKIGINTQATAITDIAHAKVGTYIYIYGNGTGANVSTIANSGKFSLTGAITLSENQVLVLYVRGVNDFVEYKRYIQIAPSDVVVELAAGATTADAALGTTFKVGINSGATAITNIVNALEGEEYTFIGNGSSNVTTIANSGNFRLSADITLAAGAELVVRYNGTHFVELSRVTP